MRNLRRAASLLLSLILVLGLLPASVTATGENGLPGSLSGGGSGYIISNPGSFVVISLIELPQGRKTPAASARTLGTLIVSSDISSPDKTYLTGSNALDYLHGNANTILHTATEFKSGITVSGHKTQYFDLSNPGSSDVAAAYRDMRSDGKANGTAKEKGHYAGLEVLNRSSAYVDSGSSLWSFRGDNAENTDLWTPSVFLEAVLKRLYNMGGVTIDPATFVRPPEISLYSWAAKGGYDYTYYFASTAADGNNVEESGEYAAKYRLLVEVGYHGQATNNLSNKTLGSYKRDCFYGGTLRDIAYGRDIDAGVPLWLSSAAQMRYRSIGDVMYLGADEFYDIKVNEDTMEATAIHTGSTGLFKKPSMGARAYAEAASKVNGTGDKTLAASVLSKTNNLGYGLSVLSPFVFYTVPEEVEKYDTLSLSKTVSSGLVGYSMYSEFSFDIKVEVPFTDLCDTLTGTVYEADDQTVVKTYEPAVQGI